VKLGYTSLERNPCTLVVDYWAQLRDLHKPPTYASSRGLRGQYARIFCASQSPWLPCLPSLARQRPKIGHRFDLSICLRSLSSLLSSVRIHQSPRPPKKDLSRDMCRGEIKFVQSSGTCKQPSILACLVRIVPQPSTRSSLPSPMKTFLPASEMSWNSVNHSL